METNAKLTGLLLDNAMMSPAHWSGLGIRREAQRLHFPSMNCYFPCHLPQATHQEHQGPRPTRLWRKLRLRALQPVFLHLPTHPSSMVPALFQGLAGTRVNDDHWGPIFCPRKELVAMQVKCHYGYENHLQKHRMLGDIQPLQMCC